MGNQKITSWFTYNLVGRLFPQIIGFLTIPLILQKLDKSSFGEFGIFMSSLFLLGLLDFGISKALVRQLNQNSNILFNDKKNHSYAYWSIFLFQFFIGFFIASCIFVLTILFVDPASISLFYIDNHYIILISIFAFGLIISSGVSRAFLEAKNEFKQLNFIKTIFGSLMYLSPIICLTFLNQGFIILIAILVKACESVVFMIYVIIKRNYFNLRDISFKYIQVLLPFGIWVMGANFVVPIIANGERYILAIALGAENFGPYYIAIELVTKTLIAVAAFTSATFPTISAYINRSNIQQFLKKINLLVLITYSIICSFLLIESKNILAIWLGDTNILKDIFIIEILCVGLIFNAMSFLSLNEAYAKGFSRPVFISYFVQIPFFLTLVYFFSINYGLLGVAFAWSIRAFIDYSILWFIANKDHKLVHLYFLNLIKIISIFMVTILFFYSLNHIILIDSIRIIFEILFGLFVLFSFLKINKIEFKDV